MIRKTALVRIAALLGLLTLAEPACAQDASVRPSVQKSDECVSATSSSWSSYEQQVWSKLCNGLAIEGKCDSASSLSTEFFADIARLPYSNYLRERPVYISHVPIGEKERELFRSFYIDSMIGRDINIYLCPGVSSAEFSKINADGDVEIVNEEGGINVYRIKAKNVELIVRNDALMTNSDIEGSLGIYSVKPDREGMLQSLTVLGTTVGGDFTISGDDATKSKVQRIVEIDGDKIKENVRIDHVNRLRANRTRIGDVLTLDVDDNGDLDLSLSEIGTLEFDRDGSYVLFLEPRRSLKRKLARWWPIEGFHICVSQNKTALTILCCTT